MNIELIKAIQDILEKELYADADYDSGTYAADVHGIDVAAKVINDKIDDGLICVAQNLSDDLEFGNWKYIYEKIKNIMKEELQNEI